jgi:transposase
MTRPAHEPMRALTEAERDRMQKVARSRAEPAEVVARAKSLLAVASGADFAAGARAGARKSGYGVSKLVRRFNRDGLSALQTHPGAGRRAVYPPELRAQIVAEFRRAPDREQDGTGTWSLTTLQRALRRQPGLEHVSRDTISGVLHAAGLSWQRTRTWCETGVSLRKGKHGTHVVVDPDAEAKKT